MGRACSRAEGRWIDDVAGHLVTHPRVHVVGGDRGAGPQVDDCPPAAGRPSAQPGDRLRARGGLVVVLVCRRRPCALSVPQGCRLHRGDGFPIRQHQPGDRARAHPRVVDGLAVHPGRVRRRTADDPDPGAAVPSLPERPPSRGGTRPSRARHRRIDGRPRRDGHECRRRRAFLAAAAQPGRPDVGQPQLRHGMGRDAARPRRSGC